MFFQTITGCHFLLAFPLCKSASIRERLESSRWIYCNEEQARGNTIHLYEEQRTDASIYGSDRGGKKDDFQQNDTTQTIY